MIAAIVLALALAFAAVTWITAWWGVIVLALVVGALWRHRAAAACCALAAALGWALLLMVDASGGRLGGVARVAGGVMRLPGVALVLVTLLFVAAAAWSAAAVAGELVRLSRSRSRPVELAPRDDSERVQRIRRETPMS